LRFPLTFNLEEIEYISKFKEKKLGLEIGMKEAFVALMPMMG